MTKRRSRILIVGALLVLVTMAFVRLSHDDDVGRPIALALVQEAQSGCGGVRTVEWTGGTWRCTFSDDFEGRGIDLTKWTVLTTRDSGYRSGVECYVDDETNVSTESGALQLTVRPAAEPFVCESPGGSSYSTRYTSGMLTTVGRFDQTYGRFQVRARFAGAKAPGLHGAIWLWPSKQTYGPRFRSGEIDIAEFYSVYPDRVIPFVHYQSAGTDPTVTNNQCRVARPDQFHTYVAEWTPDAITISFDGKVCMSTGWDQAAPLTNPAPFDRPFYLNLTQALGIGPNSFDPQRTPLPASMQVDYVRVWG